MCCKRFTTLLLTSLFVIGALFVPTARVYALFSCIPIPGTVPDLPVSVPVSNVGAAIRQNISNTYQSSQTLKECIWDATVTFLKEALIQNITGSIVDWINNDFEGGPAFVTDPAGFFVNIADETAGNFIETQLGPIGQILCSPFDLRLRLNLWLSTSASRKQYLGCRLTDIQKNAYEAFTTGGFMANGGWSTFNSLTSDPRNNQYGAFLYASDALNTEFIKKANEKLRELSEGRGFLSYKKCTAYSTATNASGGHDCAKYEVQTPGSLINNQLNNAFGSELRKIELADEINEVFEALANYGLRKVFTAANGGLLGASRKGAEKNATVTTNFNRFFNDAQNDQNTTRNLNSKVSELNASDPTRAAVGAAAGSAGAGSGQTAFERNLAYNRPAKQSEEYDNNQSYTADNAVNGSPEGGASCYSKFSCAAFTGGSNYTPYWEVGLEKVSFIKEVRIYKATDRTYSDALATIILSVLDANRTQVFSKQLTPSNGSTIPLIIPIQVAGKFVRIQKEGRVLGLAEVEVYGTEDLTNTGTSATPPTGVTAPPPNTTPTLAVPANTQATPEVKFVVNEALRSARVSITITRLTGGEFVTATPSQIFSKTLVRVKNQTTGDIKFEETFTNNEAKDYLTKKTFDAVAGESIVVGYELTSTTVHGKFGLITQLVDSKDKPIPGAANTMTIEVP